MGHLQGNLDTATDDASHQSLASLITALANTDQKIKEIMFLLPFPELSPQSTKIQEMFLPRFNRSDCQKLTGLTLSMDGAFDGTYQYTFASYSLTGEDYRVPKVDPVFVEKIFDYRHSNTDKEELKFINSMMQQASSNGFLLQAELRVSKDDDSPASLVSYLTFPYARPISINTEWGSAPSYIGPDEVSKQAALETEYKMVRTKPVPPACSSLIGRQLSIAAQRAGLGIIFGQNNVEMILYPLKALPPHKTKNGNWSLEFAVDGSPRVFARATLDSLLFPRGTNKTLQSPSN